MMIVSPTRIFGAVTVAVATLPAWGFAQSVVINEVHYDPEDKTQPLEFIELHNPGPAAVDLTGYRFDQGISFAFPPATSLPANGYLVVAENPTAHNATYGSTALGPWVGQLDNDGESVRLRDADGDVADRVDYRASSPWPIGSSGEGGSMELIHPLLDNDLAGSWRASNLAGSSGEDVLLLPGESTGWRYRKGISEASSPVDAWRHLGFVEDGSWSDGQASIGYGDGDDHTLLPDMRGGYYSVYLRHTFVIPDAASLPDLLRLRVYVDDGCIIWANGYELRRPYMTGGFKAHNDTAIQHTASWEEFEIPVTENMVHVGTNQLAVHAFNTSLTSSDLSIDVELYGRQGTVAPGSPTPGARNRKWLANAPPQVRQISHLPRQPLPTQPILITAKVTDPHGVGQVTANIQDVLPGAFIPGYLPLDHATLLSSPTQEFVDNPAYRHPDNWLTVPLHDDGTGGDILAGDDIYSAFLPPRSTNRTLVRYTISAEDSLGASVLLPYADDDSLNYACYVYAGVPAYTASVQSVHTEGAGHVYPTNLLTSLPIYHLITRVEDYDECVAYDGGLTIPKGHEARNTFNWPGAFVYDGVVYDHIRYRLRQANDRYTGTGRRSFRYRFNRGHYLQARDEQGDPYPTRWRTLNTSKMHRFGSAHNFGLYENMNGRLWRMVGVPAPFIHYGHLRMVRGADEHDQYYGDFQGLTMAQEDYDSRFLNAHGLPDGNLYKLKDGVLNGYELKRNQGRESVVTPADYEHIKANLTPAQDAIIWDSQVRWDRWYPYHVICEAVRHYDLDPDTRWHKNRAWYFEPSSGTPFGLMWVLPHDSDASWSKAYHDERLTAQTGYANNSVGVDYPHQAIFGYFVSGDPVRVAPAAGAPYRTAYRNVLRDIRDLLFTEEVITRMVTETADAIREFSLADRDRWKGAPADVGYESDIAIEAREQEMLNFAFVSETWFGTHYPGGRAVVLDILAQAEGDGALIPYPPTMVYCGPTHYPVNNLCFSSGPFLDPQGTNTFGAIQWRVGEITDTNAPAYDPTDPLVYEYEAAWHSGEESTFPGSIVVPGSAVKVGHAYRARVRMKDNTGRWSHWSAPLEFIAGAPDNAAALVADLRVTEIMYHPGGDESLEFIELYNAGSAALLLNGVSFTRGVTYSFPERAQLDPGMLLLLVNEDASLDLSAFRAAYGLDASAYIVGPYQGRLSNEGEELRMKTAFGGGEILSIDYRDDGDWPRRADGHGSSLEIIDPHGDPGAAANWRASADFRGTPGVLPTAHPTPVRVNEILAHTDPPLVDSVELYNPSGVPIDISGWYLSDSWTYAKYTVPSNTIIAPFGTFVIDEHDFNTSGNTNLDFAFSGAYGDDVHLVETDAGGGAIRFADSQSFGATANQESVGRWPHGRGPLYPMRNLSLDAPNPGPRFGPVLISEIMYHPADTNFPATLEFVEITNTGLIPESLTHWTLGGAVEFSFPSGPLFPAGSSLVIVGFDPADTVALTTFQQAYGPVTPFGPWTGQLNNAGETIRLARPDTPPAEDPGYYPMLEEERITYDEATPWPSAADGAGPSLQRRDLLSFGDTPANWVALTPTPGTHPADPHYQAWRQQHFTPAELADSLVSGDPADPDNDQMSNRDEYLAGTNPRSNASFLLLDMYTNNAGRPLVTFPSSSKRNYELQVTGQLSTPSWSAALTINPGSGSIMEWVPVQDDDSSAYRLKVSVPSP